MILVWIRRAIAESSHSWRGLSGVGRASDFSQNSGTYIVYNSHVNCSNSSFSLVMVTPMSHFFIFHWLQFTSMCCSFPIGYLLKLISMGEHICHYLLSSTTSIGQGDIWIITLLILSSARWSCLHLQDMVTFR